MQGSDVNDRPGDQAGNGSQPGNSPSSRKLPKNFLTPWILLLLKQWQIHGYLLMQYLKSMGIPAVDHATLYKELRNLEKEGFISSEWQTDGNGAAKRVYRLTESGEQMLRGWADVVAGYQRMINGFFDMYSEVFGAGSREPGDTEETQRSSAGN